MKTRILVLAVCLSMNAAAALGQHIVGHRGAAHDAPENTLPSFQMAWEQGADAIEGDFRLSADGKVVCIHDADTERTAGTKLVVAETPYEQLKQLDVGAWKGPEFAGTHPPLLEEVLAIVPAGKMIFIELKVGPEIVAPLAEQINQSEVPSDKILVISFDQETLAACAAQMPNVRTHWLSSFDRTQQGWQPQAPQIIHSLEQAKARGFGSKAMPEHFDGKLIEQLNLAGFDEFHVWTVDDPQMARFYLNLGAFSITTNRPGWLRKQLAELKAK